MEQVKLIGIIEDAFNDVEQPVEITLHVAEAHDNYDYNHNAEHRKKDYIGQWQRIPEDHLRNCTAALSFVDKIGIRFYLPAYMIWYLKNMGNIDAVIPDFPLYALDNNPSDTKLNNYHEERFSLFNSEQLRACALFVKFCANCDSELTDVEFAKKKYERYWCKFE